MIVFKVACESVPEILRLRRWKTSASSRRAKTPGRRDFFSFFHFFYFLRHVVLSFEIDNRYRSIFFRVRSTQTKAFLRLSSYSIFLSFFFFPFCPTSSSVRLLVHSSIPSLFFRSSRVRRIYLIGKYLCLLQSSELYVLDLRED